MSINQLMPLESPKESADQTSIRPAGSELTAEHRTFCMSMIVAVGRDGAIGRDGDLIWHLPGDLRRFKKITTGHTIIMGRRTWESLPKGALPNRRNIVISRNPAYQAPGAEVFPSPEDALRACRADGEVFVIGGATLYRQMLPLATRLYLTKVEAECEDADARFELPDPQEWLQVSESDEFCDKGVCYRFIDYVRSRQG